MNFIDFLHGDKICPICNNTLTLYMQWSSYNKNYCNKLFKSSPANEEGVFIFNEENLDNKSERKSKQIAMSLKLNDNDYVINFNSLAAEKLAKNQEEIHFYYLCNPDSIIKTGDDYEIEVYSGCYHRSTVMCSFSKDDTYQVNPISSTVNINRDENFVFKTKNNDLEKIYIVILSSADNETTFYHYSVNDEEIKNAKHESNLFEKKMPLLNNKFDFSDDNRNNLISRFDSWVALS